MDEPKNAIVNLNKSIILSEKKNIFFLNKSIG